MCRVGFAGLGICVPATSIVIAYLSCFRVWGLGLCCCKCPPPHKSLHEVLRSPCFCFAGLGPKSESPSPHAEAYTFLVSVQSKALNPKPRAPIGRPDSATVSPTSLALPFFVSLSSPSLSLSISSLSLFYISSSLLYHSLSLSPSLALSLSLSRSLSLSLSLSLSRCPGIFMGCLSIRRLQGRGCTRSFPWQT